MKVRPTVLVTHPTGAFLDSLAGLRDRGALPRVRLILLVHNWQRRLAHRLRRLLKRHGFRGAEIVKLVGFPAHKRFNDYVARHRGPFPDRHMARFHISRHPYLPAEWRRQFTRLVEKTDALFIPGGSNIPAAFYGEKQFVEGVSATPIRTLYELSLLAFLLDGKHAYLNRRPSYLVVGFCYGMQAINVALGGTLWQSIPIEVYRQYYVEDVLRAGTRNMHRNYNLALYPSTGELYRGWFHPVRLSRSTPYFRQQDGVYLLSNHHQGVRTLGKELEVVGTSADGRIPELLRHTRFPNVLGLQGHPERRFAWRRLPELPPATRRFHETFWQQVSRVLKANLGRRMVVDRR